MKKGIAKIFQWNVISISYTTLRVIAVVGLLLIVGLSLGLYYYFTKEPTDMSKARSLLQEVTVGVRKIERVDAKYYDNKLFMECKSYASQAKDAFTRKEYNVSGDYSEQALDLIFDLNEQIEIKKKPHRALYAIITYISGEVNIRRSGEFAWIKASKNTRLGKGDTVRTLTKSEAVITFEDESKMHLYPNSYMEIGALWEDRKTRKKQSNVRLVRARSKVDFATVNIDTNLSIETPIARTRIKQKKTEGQLHYKENEDLQLTIVRGEATVKRKGEAAGQDGGDIMVGSNKLLGLNAKSGAYNIEDLPLPPLLISPVDKKIVTRGKGHMVLLQWIQVPKVAEYLLEVSNNPYFASAVNKQLHGNSIQLVKLKEGNYYWRVASVNERGFQGGFSNYFYFKVIGDTEIILSNKAPSLLLESPMVFGPFVIISGRTDKGMIIFANNKQFDVNEDGRFEITLRLDKPGDNIITVVTRNPKNDLETREDVTVNILG